MCRIKEYRELKGLTQKQLAEKLGVTREHICKVETNQVNPSVRLAFRLRDELQPTVEDLLTSGDN